MMINMQIDNRFRSYIIGFGEKENTESRVFECMMSISVYK